MKIVAKTKEIIEQYVIQDGKEYLVKFQYNQREYTDFNQKPSISSNALNYMELNEANQKEKQELTNKLILELRDDIRRNDTKNHEDRAEQEKPQTTETE